MPEFTRYKKRISYRFSHREKKSCVFSAAGSLTVVLFRCPDALRRLTASPGYVIPAARLQLLLSSITLIFFFLPLHFLLLTSSLFFFSFFAYLYLRIFLFLFFYAYLYVSISPHFRSTTASIATNFPSVRMFACAFFFFFFCTVYAWLHTFLLLDTLACTFSFLFLFSLFCMHTLACIFNFTKCICLPDVMYFFCVYLYVCILLLEVYIQGCVFIYKNAYLKRTHKKKKCIHYGAHFFLPAAAGRVFKMYIHACTFKKPAQRAGHISKNAYICRHIFFDGFMHTHACTLFSSFIILPAPFRLPAAGIFPPFLCAFLLPFSSWCFCDCFAAISLPLCRQTYILFLHLFKPFAAHFLHFFFFVHYPQRIPSIDEKYLGRKVVQNQERKVCPPVDKDFIQTEKKIKVNNRKRKKKREK